MAIENKDDSQFIIQIRDQLFYIEVWMYNEIDGFDPLAVPFMFIEGLAIEESLMSWVTKGWIVLSNDFELFERGAAVQSIKPKDTSPTQSKKFDAPYMFRNDGRNRLSMKIYPIVYPNGKPPETITSDTILPKEQWEMNFDFVIYDIEDIDTQSASKKLKKLYFWDERYQIMMERNLDWSTALYSNTKAGTGTFNPTDIQRTMTCSNALKSIIRAAASDDSTPENPKIMVGNSDGPKFIDVPNILLSNIDDSKWDEGHADSIVFYTSPANSTVIDDISYIMENMKASDGSPVFLELDRQSRKWNLLPLSYFFKESYTNQIERILIVDNLIDAPPPDQKNVSEDGANNTNTSTPYIGRAKYDIRNEESLIQNFQSNVASRITNYKFSPMVSADDMNLANSPVHNYNFATGEYTTSFYGNTLSDVNSKIREIAQGNSDSQGLYSLSTANRDGQILMNINKTKAAGLMTNNNFIARSFFPSDISSLKMLKDFVFLNETLYFSTMGLTLRTPGKFLFVDREFSSNKNPFDDRFLGQWMIVKCIHLFTKTSYTTDVVATKIDSFSKWWDEMDRDTKY